MTNIVADKLRSRQTSQQTFVGEEKCRISWTNVKLDRYGYVNPSAVVWRLGRLLRVINFASVFYLLAGFTIHLVIKWTFTYKFVTFFNNFLLKRCPTFVTRCRSFYLKNLGTIPNYTLGEQISCPAHLPPLIIFFLKKRWECFFFLLLVCLF